MGLFDFLKNPVLDHPVFGEMKFSGGFWQCTVDYLEYVAVTIRLCGTRNGIDPAAQKLCDGFEKQFESLAGEIGEVLYAESYTPVREAIGAGDFLELEDEDIPTISSPADVWQHLRVAQVEFGASGEPDRIEIAFGTDWEIEHVLGIGIKNGKYDYFNGSVLLAR